MSSSTNQTSNIDVDTILPLINSGRSAKGIKQLGRGDQSVTMLATSEMTPCLLALNQGTLDPNTFPSVLKVCTEMTSSTTIRFYLRQLTITRANLTQYAIDFAGDSAWANTLLQSKAEASVNRNRKDDDLSFFYIGMTRKDPLHRADNDANLSDKSSSSRISNISKKCQVVCYEWIQLARPFVNEKSYRQDSISQDIERNLIAIGGSQLANSAAGGFYYPWSPSPLLLSQLGPLQKHLRIQNFSSLMGSIQVRDLSEQMTPHFFGMRNFYRRIEGPNVKVTNDRCLSELIEEHEQVVKVRGRTMAALITKDITLEALDGGYGYTSNTSGPGPWLEMWLRAQATEAINIPATATLFPTARTDLWPCTVEKTHLLVAVLFLSRYLLILRPLLVVSHSRRILETFNEDLLSLCWKSTKTANNFVGLEDFSKLDANTIQDRFAGTTDFTRFETFTKDTIVDHLGKISVVKFGPSTKDYCLLLPERDSGNPAYEPMKADVYCQLSFLTKLVYFVAVPHLVDFVQSSKATTRKNLLALRDTITKSVKRYGLEDLIEAAKQAVRAVDGELTTTRMVARNKRQADALGPEGSKKAHVSRMKNVRDAGDERAVRAIGNPRSKERQKQIAQIEGRIRDKVSRGVTLTKAERSLFPAQYEPLSTESTEFLLGVKEDVPLYKAAKSSTPHAGKYTVAGKAALHAAQKKAAQEQRPHWGLAMKNLAKQDFAPRMSHFSLSNCSLCGQDILWYPTLQHRCPSKNDEDDNSPPDSVRVHLYYPHSIFERLSVEEQEHIISLIDKEETGNTDIEQGSEEGEVEGSEEEGEVEGSEEVIEGSEEEIEGSEDEIEGSEEDEEEKKERARRKGKGRKIEDEESEEEEENGEDEDEGSEGEIVEIDMEQDMDDEGSEEEEEGQDMGSSSRPKKHPDGVYFQSKTTLRYISAFDALVRVAKTVPVFKSFIDETLAESTSSQHTLLKGRLVFYPSTYDILPKTNTAKDDERWLATMAIDILLRMVNTFPKGLLPDEDGWVFSSVSRSNSLDAVWSYFKTQPAPVTLPYVSGCSNTPSCGQFKLNFERRVAKQQPRHSCQLRGGERILSPALQQAQTIHGLPPHAVRYLWFKMYKNDKVTDELANEILQWPNLQRESSSKRRRT
ncbi:MAG: hypothetical protein J3R72DRAFT_423753 [Linnemannia gamsii]|nr:MAG: hypothetical protein J3R72DRAFT_427060 [Linnemannia gamsii]KAK3836756.1 MAG: hypothetical protein J3R72DRAFT_423753 [Linnemannia gamsii]